MSENMSPRPKFRAAHYESLAAAFKGSLDTHIGFTIPYLTHANEEGEEMWDSIRWLELYIANIVGAQKAIMAAAKVFRDDNPRYDHEKFMEASGYRGASRFVDAAMRDIKALKERHGK